MQYLSFIDNTGSMLSDGQKQPILLAHGLYCEPKVLVLDKGTAKINPDTEESITELVSALPIAPIVFAHGAALIAPRGHAIPVRGVYRSMLMFIFAKACRRCAELKRGRRELKSEVRFDVQSSARLEPRWATFGSEPTMRTGLFHWIFRYRVPRELLRRVRLGGGAG
ncbi:MAG: hypothetical protein ACP5QR_06430 [Rhizomicrobium sp.]